MRWLSGADGPGPDYCTSCKKVRQSSTECEGCNRPELLPENDIAVAWFRLCDTQWRVGGMGSLTGLDYAGAQRAAEMAGLEVTADDFHGLQVLERETLKVMSEHGKNEH